MNVLVDHANLTNSQLVQQCQLGDTDSFRLIYQRYQPKVRATLYQLCGSELLDDLIQEVFLKAWKSVSQLREVHYFSTWLYRICWNVASDRRRQLARLRQTNQSMEHDLNPINDYQQTDWLTLHYQQLVQQGLQHLSLEHRAVLVLHDLEDVSQKEIAQILSIPVGTVKSRLFNARKTMRQFLEQQGVKL
jgi:RNA polymerase sigma-70 factor (ECF subfamily)